MRPQQNARKWVDFEVDFEAYFESELKLTDEVAAKLFLSLSSFFVEIEKKIKKYRDSRQKSLINSLRNAKFLSFQ